MKYRAALAALYHSAYDAVNNTTTLMKFSAIEAVLRDELLLSDMYMTKLKRLVTGVGRRLGPTT